MENVKFSFSVVVDHPDYPSDRPVIEYTDSSNNDDDVNLDLIVDGLIGKGSIPIDVPQVTGNIVIQDGKVVKLSYEVHKEHISI